MSQSIYKWIYKYNLSTLLQKGTPDTVLSNILKTILLVMMSLSVIHVQASTCESIFASNPQEEVFYKMKNEDLNYVRFSLSDRGNLQVHTIKTMINTDFDKSLEVIKFAPFAGAVLATTHKAGRGQELAKSYKVVSNMDLFPNSYVWDVLKQYGHESLHFIYDRESGLKSIIGIHNTNIQGGEWALGGTRMWDYKTEKEGLIDVLRLSQGMSHKAALANVNFGGGKAVIFGSPETDKTTNLLHTYGYYLKVLDREANKKQNAKPHFITAIDVNISPKDIKTIHRIAPGHVVGFSKKIDPSLYTAQGVMHGIRAAAKYRLKREDLTGLEMSIQGVGNVGEYLVEYLTKAGAHVSIYDIDTKKAKCLSQKFGVRIKSSQQILQGSCDVFVPCALGSIINTKTVKNFKCKIIAGSANNQLENVTLGTALKKKGILYVPDYIVNAGGLISVSPELKPKMSSKKTKALIQEKTAEIYHTLMRIFEIADKENISTAEAADRLAKTRIKEAQYISDSVRWALSKGASLDTALKQEKNQEALSKNPSTSWGAKKNQGL